MKTTVRWDCTFMLLLALVMLFPRVQLVRADTSTIGRGMLSGEEIRELLSGNTMVPTSGKAWAQYFDPDGLIVGRSYLANLASYPTGKVFKGEWEVSGDVLKRRYSNHRSYEYWVSEYAPGYVIFYDINTERSGIMAKIVPGNQL